MGSPLPERDTALLLDVAKTAGEIAMRYFRADHRVWDKEGGAGPVTEADLAVDAMLKERLLAARPGYGWMSEETADNTARLDAERVFIIDPIDGTRAFTEGQESWAHSFAVAVKGEVVAAVIHMPAKGVTYTATRGAGATRNGALIRVSSPAPEGDVSIITGKPNLSASHWPGGVPPHTRHYRPSIAYRLGLVAEGRYDAMVTFRPSWEWDIAAGALIVAEAGGEVSDASGKPISFNSPSRLADGTVAAASTVYGALMQRMFKAG